MIIYTVDDFLRTCVDLRLTCFECGHGGNVPRRAIEARAPRSHHFRRLRFKCSVCGCTRVYMGAVPTVEIGRFCIHPAPHMIVFDYPDWVPLRK